MNEIQIWGREEYTKKRIRKKFKERESKEKKKNTQTQKKNEGFEKKWRINGKRKEYKLRKNE